MLEQKQHFIDLQEHGSFGDPKSWLSEEHHPHSSSSSSSNAPATGGSFDRVLFRNLVEMVPLVESLMDRRANTSFTRRASMVYTRTPSRDSFASKKIVDPKGRKMAQTNPSKKKREFGDDDRSKNNRDKRDESTEDFSIFSSRSLAIEKDREELIALKEQVEDLQKKLLEKDEVLKSAENSLNQMNSVHNELNEMKKQVLEKDSLIKSAQLQLSNAKIKLADKQASLEKLGWEAMSSNRKVEKLQEDLDSMQGEIATFMRVFEELAKSDSTVKETYFNPVDQLPQMDPIDETQMQKMEEARLAYVAAVAAAKENPTEESLAAAAEARLELQAFAFGPKNINAGNTNSVPFSESPSS